MANPDGAIPNLAPPKRAIRAAMAALRCRSSSSGSTVPSTSSPVDGVGSESALDVPSPSAIIDLEISGVSRDWTEMEGVLSSVGEVGGSSPVASLSMGLATAGGGFHLGFSIAGLGARGGDGAPKAPFPCKAAIRSFKLPPPFVMLSLASEADIAPVALNGGEAAWSVVLEDGEVGGDCAFGFQDANPEGLGRGAGGGLWPADGGAEAEDSKAAILSRKEPGLGFWEDGEG